MIIHFVTSNQGKLQEIQAIVPQVVQLDIDLPEVQGIDPHDIIKAKLAEATKLHDGPLIVEDTSLFFEGLNGLPGPLIKWFIKTIDLAGLYKMATAFGNTRAYGLTTIGLAHDGKIEFFEGRIDGEVVAPRGDLGFGWDPIFQPAGHDKTFGQMTREEKNQLSMRKIAAEQLKQYLSKETR